MPQPGGIHLEANDIPLNGGLLPTPIELAPIDLLRDGGMGEDDDHPTKDQTNPVLGQSPVITPTEPPRRGIIQTLKTGVIAALGRHADTAVTTRNAWGKEVTKTLKSRDVFEIDQEVFARLRSTEFKDKWDPKSVEGLNGWQRFGKSVERFFDRTWRTMATENVHLAKEKKHGMELSAIVGIDSAVSEEFHTVLDQAARKKLEETRQTRTQKFLGGTKDFFQELFGQERDLHKFKVVEAARLAAEYRSNPADTSHPLYQLINRDTTTREQFAARINESPLELLQQTNAKDKKVEGIQLKGEHGAKVDTFLKKQIIEKAMDDIISRNELSGDRSGKINAKLRRELDQTIQDYLIGDEFQAWRSTLTEEQQKSYENSFTVASDVLLQFEEGMAPAILDNLEHYKGADRLNFEIELSLGTAQMSANTESMGGTYKERHTERASLNEKIWNSSQSKDLHSNEAINTGLKRTKLLSAASMIWRNEAIGAFAGAATGRGIAALARTGFSALPIIGSSAVAGTMAGFKEWARHGQMRSTYGMGRAEGLEFPDASNAIRTAEMRSADYHRVGFSERTQRFVDLSNKLGSDNFDNNTILLTMAQIADSGARLKLGNERDINLLVASKDGPEGRGIRNRELRIHDQARAVSTAKVRELLSDQSRLTAIASEMGFTIPAGTSSDDATNLMIDVLQTSQYNSLLGATTVSPAIATLVSNLSPELAYNQLESVTARDKIYNGLRWKSTGKKAATSAAIAGLMSFGMTRYAEAHQSVVDTGTEHQLVPLIDHKLPQHIDPLPTGEIHNPTDGDVLAVMHAHVPSGTHLVAAQERVGGPDDFEPRFNLVTDHLSADGKPEVLVSNMEIGGHGQVHMTTEIRDALAHNHLELKHEALAPVTWGGQESTDTPEIDYTQWDNTLHYKDFPDQSPDGFFAQNINNSLAAHPEISTNGETLTEIDRVTDINGLRYFMRGMENWIYKQENVHVNQIEGFHRDIHAGESMWSKITGRPEFLVKPQSDTTDILHVPDLLATEEGNRRVVDLIHEAVRDNPTGDIHHQFVDEAHRIAWEMSYWGDEAHVPDANETIALLQYFGEIPGSGTVENAFSATPHDISITMTEDFSKVMEVPGDQIFAPGWASVFSTTIGYSRPLESPGYNKLRPNVDRSSYYYGTPGGQIEVRASEYNSRKSPQLHANPTAKLNQKQEIDWYLNAITTDEKQVIQELEQQHDGIIKSETEAVVCIPLYKEANNIENSLNEYAKQVDQNGNSLGNKMTIVLYNNYTGDAAPDNTKAIVDQYKQSHPELNIVLLDHGYEKKATMGRIRKDVTNYVLSQIGKAGHDKDIVLISNDGDVVKLSNKYISYGLNQFSTNEKLDALSGKLDFPEDVYKQIPTLFAEQRAWQFLDTLIKNKMNSGIPELSGANTMYRASILAGIGGYNEKSGLGEDLEIGWMIKNDRNWAEGSIKYDNKVAIQTNPRRAVIEWMKGRGIVDRYASFTNNEEVYENKWNELINGEGIPYNRENLQSSLNSIRTQLYGWIKDVDPTQFEEYFLRSMNFLGVKYRIEDEKVIILDDTQLLEGLAKTVPAQLLP